MRLSECPIPTWSQHRPTALPSRTDTFRSRARAATPFRQVESDSSDAEAGTFTSGESDDQGTQRHVETGVSSFSGESDSAGEMALISASNKPAAQSNHTWAESATMAVSDDQRGHDTDPSSQDATLSEVREQTLSGKPRRNTQVKRSQKPKRQSQRGVPCARSSSPK